MFVCCACISERERIVIDWRKKNWGEKKIGRPHRPILNTLPQAYLRSCDLVIRHQSLPKYSSNPQVHVWPRTDQMPGCELAPPRSSHFTEDASDLTYVNFSQHITQNAVQFNSRELYWNKKQQTAWSWMSSVMYFMGSCGPQESWMLMLAYCN